MKLSRRAFNRGTAAVAAATLLPARSRAADIVHVRRSIADLTRENSALIESYRRAVEAMMERPVTDKTSWRFQANMVGAAASEIGGDTQPLAKYWRQNPRKSYFFLSWQRMHLYFFERILRRASGDPVFALPYWAYEEAQQRSLPEPFRPGSDQLEMPVAKRRNALARTLRRCAVRARHAVARRHVEGCRGRARARHIHGRRSARPARRLWRRPRRRNRCSRLRPAPSRRCTTAFTS